MAESGCYCLNERRSIEDREDVAPQNWCDDWPGCVVIDEGEGNETI
jgi:hypothetical protein